MKEYVWKLGKLGFMCVSKPTVKQSDTLITASLQLAIHYAGRSAYQRAYLEPIRKGVRRGRHEGLYQHDSREGDGGGLRSC